MASHECEYCEHMEHWVCGECTTVQETKWDESARITTLEAALAERDAEVGRLRGAAEELIEVAELRGDNVLEHPANDPLLWTARMQTAWVELEEALTPILEEKPNGD